MLGKIVTGNQDIDFVNPNAENLVEKVSPKKLAIYQPNPKSEIRFSTENLLKASNPKQYQNSNDKNSKRFEHSNLENSNLFRVSKFDIRNSPKIGLLNCGAKRNILRNLLARRATVYELPWDYDPFLNGLPIDGLVISNGPGDPKMATESIEIIKKALKHYRKKSRHLEFVLVISCLLWLPAETLLNSSSAIVLKTSRQLIFSLNTAT